MGSEKFYKRTMEYTDKWKENKGELSFKMCNDYLFRALLQSDEDTLKAIISAFLKKDPSTIREVEVTNPIILGESIDEKEIHLDIRTIVDNEREMDFEIQLINHDGWRERTLIYACRAYDKLDHGDDYRNARGIWQISFCNFTLFPEAPEFYSTYMFTNQKNPSQVYSDKIKISCVDLKSVHLATDDDCSSGIDLWAKLFNTGTWEELKTMADENKRIDKAVSSAWQLSEDAEIRDQMRRREENERFWNSREKLVKSLQSELEEKKAELEAKNIEIITIKDEQKAQLEEIIALKTEIERLKRE